MNNRRLARLITAALAAFAFTVAGHAADTTNKSRNTSSEPARTAKSGKVNLNTADRETLEALPGVGPIIAGAIIAGRPFTTVNDLELVPGIGPARLAELREHVTVSPHRSATARRDTSRDLEPTGRGTTTPAANRSSRVNLNTATRAELEALPEIGPVKAQAIIDARPFASTRDVMRVKGIKEGTYEVIKDQITVR